MNYVLDIFLVLLIALTAFIFKKKGLVASIFEAVKTVAALIASYVFCVPVGEWIHQRIIYSRIYNVIYDMVSSVFQNIESAISVEDFLARLPDGIIEVMNQLGISAESLLQKLGAGAVAGQDTVSDIAGEIATTASSVASIACAFIIIFIVALIVLSIVQFIVVSIFRIPGLREVDHFFGLLLGAAVGIIYSLVICNAIAVALGMDIGSDAMEWLRTTADASFLFDLFTGFSPVNYIEALF